MKCPMTPTPVSFSHVANSCYSKALCHSFAEWNERNAAEPQARAHVARACNFRLGTAYGCTLTKL